MTNQRPDNLIYQSFIEIVSEDPWSLQGEKSCGFVDKVGWRERNQPRPRVEQISDESGNHIFDETDYQIHDETMFGMKEGAGLRAQTHKLK